MPKVSIVVPVYNVERYLSQCLDSIVHQTLEDIEVICVNDGSRDSSPEILRRYADQDPRVHIVNKENTGYGNSMNIGFDHATGDYIGIVESDDYADPGMFEYLYRIASANELDVIKSSYYFYYSVPREKNVKEEIVSSALNEKLLCPRTSFPSNMERAEFFNIKPTIWSSIYRRDFIEKNHIKFNETPGASYQDAGFNFKVWCCARRVMLTDKAFLHYRQDNENSSVNSAGKVFCVCDEYREMERFLKEEHPEFRDEMEPVKNRIKYDSYMWNYERVGLKYKYLFIERASLELKEDMEEGNLDQSYFEWYKWIDLLQLIEDPVVYHTQKMTKQRIVNQKEYEDIRNSMSFRIGRAATAFPRLVRGGLRCVRDHGLVYTVRYSFRKAGSLRNHEKS